MNCVLVILLSVICGCSEKTNIQLDYSITIPSNVPKTMTFYPKHGEAHTKDAHKMYRNAHKVGWVHCIHDFNKGGFRDESKTILRPQQYGLQCEANNNGYNECKKAIQLLVEKYGLKSVRTALKNS